jgi:hypothetical protein
MGTLERFIFTDLPNKLVADLAETFDGEGVIQQSGDYCYLNVDDHYIHQIYPMLAQYGRVDKPDYFNVPDGIGAHISVIYPEEKVRVLPSSVGQKHSFSVFGLFKAQYGMKEYFILSVDSPSLAAFRQLHYLTPRPIWKRQEVMFHITIGVRNNSAHSDEDLCNVG